MLILIFPKGTTMTKNKFLILASVLFLCYLVSVPIKNGWTDSDKSQTPKYFVKNKVQYEYLPFDLLSSFRYPMPQLDEEETGTVSTKIPTKNLIPDNIRALNGKKVAIQGFVLPLDADKDGNQNLLLVDQIVTCMFCQGVRINEWVYVIVTGKPVKIKDEQYEDPFTVYGQLEVGEHYQDGQLLSIYQLKADGIQVEKKGILGNITGKWNRFFSD